MSHVLTERGLSIVIDGLPHLIPRAHPDWDRIVQLLDDPVGLRRLLNPTSDFKVGERWRTRAGSTAVIVEVCPRTRRVTALVDDCYEIDTLAGLMVEGHESDDDLIEKEH